MLWKSNVMFDRSLAVNFFSKYSHFQYQSWRWFETFACKWNGKNYFIMMHMKYFVTLKNNFKMPKIRNWMQSYFGKRMAQNTQLNFLAYDFCTAVNTYYFNLQISVWWKKCGLTISWIKNLFKTWYLEQRILLEIPIKMDKITSNKLLPVQSHTVWKMCKKILICVFLLINYTSYVLNFVTLKLVMLT